MSDGKAPSGDIFSINVCSQCLKPFTGSGMQDARHAVPCGHVICKACSGVVDAEQKAGTSYCRSVGCGKRLSPSTEYGVASCAQRAERVKTELQAMFCDQGNAGDAAGMAVVGPELSVCAHHSLPFQGVEAATHRPMCRECITATEGKASVQTFDEAMAALETADAAAVSAELAKQKSKLSEPVFTADGLRTDLSMWGADQMALIRAWEEREVKHVQKVANDTVQLVQEVCARKIEVGASVLTQRMGLLASLEEFDNALSDLPSDPASRVGQIQSVYANRRQLLKLLAESKIAVPSAEIVLRWARLPMLPGAFDKKVGDTDGVLAKALWSEVREELVQEGGRAPWAYLNRPRDSRAFPVIPKLVRLVDVRVAERKSAAVGLRTLA